MTEPTYLTTPQGRRIAYHLTAGQGPCVVFLGGFKSDMTGTKAVYLQQRAEVQGRALLRFDYSGHGQSGGAFLDGAIGDWFEDALAVITAVTSGPLLLVGSSMGGWMALLLARAMPERIVGLVGIAAAPDFTEDSMWADFTDAERAEMAATGRVVSGLLGLLCGATLLPGAAAILALSGCRRWRVPCAGATALPSICRRIRS